MVTGGAGYIGSHTTLALLQNGYNVVVVDNLCNSYRESLRRVHKLAPKKIKKFYKLSIGDKAALTKVFKRHRIDAVIHFAGLKSVNESISNPVLYYQQNVAATCTLIEVMQAHNCKKIIFSSSATVYGNAKDAFIKETAPTAPMTPYGRSKLMCEDVIRDTCNSWSDWSAAVLRYFNPVSAHSSSLIGESPRNAPNNLMPSVTAAMISRKPLKLFGNDYNTSDGTTIRDYIHVVDLADSHVAALKKVLSQEGCFHQIYNIGNGRGATIMELIDTMTDVTGVKVPYVISARRPGDAECVVADPAKAFVELKWQPKLGLEEMCCYAWKWQEQNPNGFRKKTLLERIKKMV